MEYLGGNSLKEYMAEKFDNDEKYYFGIGWTIGNIVLPVYNALAQAHSSNIYHRDLKPSNIIFTDDTKSSIKIADWGLVKIGESSDSNSSYNTSTTIDLDRRSLDLTAVVNSPSEYNSLIPPPLDQCVLRMIDLKPENRHNLYGI